MEKLWYSHTIEYYIAMEVFCIHYIFKKTKKQTKMARRIIALLNSTNFKTPYCVKDQDTREDTMI